jgi:aspartyl protease family protein
MQSARRAWLALCVAAPLGVLAQGVSLSGQMGAKALLVIDGQPQMLAVGETSRGVRLLRLDAGEAQVERDGQVHSLRLGAPAQVAGTPAAGGRTAQEIVIAGGPGGHFVAGGAINGRPVRFMVDTGATLVTLSQAEAERIGLDYRSGQRGVSQTANGSVESHHLTLARVRVGEVELAHVGAVVVPAPMPHVLLGNSFLARFQMRRDADVMRLLPR